ncbi:MAG: LacI family transcriptional regulator [Ruminococcaceae bacterium]|nr:LacI family transcriptional regulator [Oscillospiraceae bacterium]
MTMKELAKLCHVSVSAVSKAFCDADDIGKETKEHIFSVAKEQGCFGKFYKGKYNKKIIAVICPEISGDYYSVFVNMLKGLIEKNNGMCIISTDDFDAKKQSELIEYYISYLKVDGLFVMGLTAQLKKGYETPIVSIFSSADNKVDLVVTDMKLAVYEAIETLYFLGHRNIAFLGETLTTKKEECFINGVKQFDDIKYSLIKSEKRFEEAGYDCANKLLEEKENYTAVICGYDNIAIGAIKRFKETGIKVPEDISVIGIDNIQMSEFTETSLTSIDVNPKDICSIAYNLMEKKLENKYFKANQSIVIKPSIVIRESIGKVK